MTYSHTALYASLAREAVASKCFHILKLHLARAVLGATHTHAVRGALQRSSAAFAVKVQRPRWDPDLQSERYSLRVCC